MNETSKKPVGRPKKEGGYLSARLPVIQLEPEKLLKYKEEAKIKDIKFSSWVRKALDKACEK